MFIKLKINFKMKNSNSGLLTNIKSNYFISNPSFTDFSPNIFQNSEKVNVLQFELDRTRDNIIKLRTELFNKTKEISLLKVQKNKKDNEHQHIVKVLDDILKQCDQSTGTGFKAVETYLNSINLKINNTEQNNIKDDERLEEIKQMIHLSEEQINTLSEIVQINKLKTQIVELNEELNKKEHDINMMKKNKNNPGYNKLKVNFVKNFNELRQIKRQNEIIKKRMEEATNMLMEKKEDNINLKNKLQEYQKKFRNYKEESTKKTESLSKNITTLTVSAIFIILIIYLFIISIHFIIIIIIIKILILLLLYYIIIKIAYIIIVKIIIILCIKKFIVYSRLNIIIIINV